MALLFNIELSAFNVPFIFKLLLYSLFTINLFEDPLFTLSKLILIKSKSNKFDNVKLELGFALGLFAIFGIIRYRTDPIPIKEMTYLFLVIGVSVLNALANKKISHAELLLGNFLIVPTTYTNKHETKVLNHVWFVGTIQFSEIHQNANCM